MLTIGKYNHCIIFPDRSMELYQLSYFIEIARQQNFTRAAARLHMAQPALSLQMKNLEAELGASLFIRGRRQTTLTAAGKALLPKAEALLAQAEATKLIVSDVIHLRAGRLIIATIPSVSASWLPGVIRGFKKQHPGIDMQLIEDSSEGVGETVESGRADLGFLQFPANKSAFETRPLITEAFVLLTVAAHPLAKKREIRLKQLSGEPFVFYKGRARDTALEACRKSGFEPHIACESGELETVRALVGAGLGLAIIPQLAALNLPRTLRAIPLREPKIQRQIGAVWKRNAPLSPAAASFLEGVTSSLTRQT